MLVHRNVQFLYTNKIKFSKRICSASTGCIGLKFKEKELTSEVKHTIEKYWREKLGLNVFKPDESKQKYYVLSMFPYPSGHLHMGHVRVYTISDAMARFYRLNGKNVLHPMGWDAFGLPAENAALQRNIPADIWTKDNINHMKMQLEELGCSFDWTREIATCSPDYYKWTQLLFLKLYKDGLAYQKEALVNWDPVDKTVLADEQVDTNGCSWRSGAKVEKKLLKQWFIKTTMFAKQLYDGLDNPILEDWKDIIKLQKHWIGDCNGYSFDLQLSYNNTNKTESRIKYVTVWTENPENILKIAFIAINKEHVLNKIDIDLKNLTVYNPFNNTYIPVIQYDALEYPEKCDTYIGLPEITEIDKEVCSKYNISLPNHNIRLNAEEILHIAKSKKIGGYLVSSKLRDWLISRQRYWGTPIPIIHCNNCGTVPLDEKDLPILLPTQISSEQNLHELACPKCGSLETNRETDTMDTFVDSSWYFLRYLDPKNDNEMFDKKLSQKLMPVDLYIGGKEHAVLHLYYARFVCCFLHSLGLVPISEPFKRLLVQGMVMGRSYRIKGSGKYIQENAVDIIDAKRNKAIEKESGNPVVCSWEKMSKSKMNGVDPQDMIGEYGCDSTRLIMLADVAPTSHRNWSSATFNGVLNWQKRIWATVNDFYNLRCDVKKSDAIPDSSDFHEMEEKMFDSRNYYTKGATFHYKYSHQLSVAISKMQGLTNSLKKASKDCVAHGPQFERALATQLIMLAPMAPHFASELWSKFLLAPNRKNLNSNEIKWENDLLEQKWPEVDLNYTLDLSIKINGYENNVVKIPRIKLDTLNQKEAIDIAFGVNSVTDFIKDSKIKTINFILYPGCEGILNIFLHKRETIKTIIQH